MASFKWRNGEVFIKPATGRSRTYYFYLKSLAGVYDMDEGFEKETYEQSLYLLSRVDKVEGDIGFNVPNGNADAESLIQFCNALMDADEDLFLSWNATAIATRAGGNAEHLLPPDEVSDDKKKPSNSKGKSKE